MIKSIKQFISVCDSHKVLALDIIRIYLGLGLLLTAKICEDEQLEYKSSNWFKENKSTFEQADWVMEIDRFHLNNDGLTKSLEDFAKALYRN